jgi:hypothetical protein
LWLKLDAPFYHSFSKISRPKMEHYTVIVGTAKATPPYCGRNCLLQ